MGRGCQAQLRAWGLHGKWGQSNHMCFHADCGNTTPPLLQPSPLSLDPGTLATKPYFPGRGLKDGWFKGTFKSTAILGFPTNRPTDNTIWKLQVDSPPGAKSFQLTFQFFMGHRAKEYLVPEENLEHGRDRPKQTA